MRRSLLIALIPLGGCEVTELPSVVGEHVVYHWAASESPLCGGTIPVLDSHVELMTRHYGWTDSGRAVEYFWDADLAFSVCSRSDTPACARRFSSGALVLSDKPIDTHELGHTTRVGTHRSDRGYIDFIEEGFATRWESAVIELTNVSPTSANFLNESELRAALENGNDEDFSYGDAFTWWLALELAYGPAKMAEFVTEVEGAATAGEVEAALLRVFGVSLAESAELAEELPAGFTDDPACGVEGLPTFTWTGAPLVVERGGASCAENDIVNVSGQGAMWMFAVDFPDTPVAVEVSVTVPEDVDPLRKSLLLTWCRGDYHIGELPPTLSASAGPPGTSTGPWALRGRNVGALRAPLGADGSVALPRVVYGQVEP